MAKYQHWLEHADIMVIRTDVTLLGYIHTVKLKSRILESRVTRILGDYANGRFIFLCILTLLKQKSREVQLWSETCQCGSLYQVILVMTNDLGKIVKTREKFWTVWRNWIIFAENFKELHEWWYGEGIPAIWFSDYFQWYFM